MRRETALALVLEVDGVAEGDAADEAVQDSARVPLALALARIEPRVQLGTSHIPLIRHAVLVDLACIVREVGPLPQHTRALSESEADDIKATHIEAQCSGGLERRGRA